MSLIVVLTKVLLGLEIMRINRVDDGPVNSGRSCIISFHIMNKYLLLTYILQSCLMCNRRGLQIPQHVTKYEPDDRGYKLFYQPWHVPDQHHGVPCVLRVDGHDLIVGVL